MTQSEILGPVTYGEVRVDPTLEIKLDRTPAPSVPLRVVACVTLLDYANNTLIKTVPVSSPPLILTASNP